MSEAQRQSGAIKDSINVSIHMAVHIYMYIERGCMYMKN